MNVCTTINEFRSIRETIREPLAFVPTMGALHQGHLSLVHEAKKFTPFVAVSIFVNPLQFNQPSDLATYPRTIEQDLALLQEAEVNMVLIPETSDIYRGKHFTKVEVTELTKSFEGASRPGHFGGVTTVVAILFNIVQPQFAVFGEKDFQQLRVIEQMVEDLHFPITIVRGTLVRENGGLALSSRNVRLSSQGKSNAEVISRALKKGVLAFQDGEVSREVIKNIILKELGSVEGVTLEYLAIVDEESLLPSDKGTRVLLTALVEGVRLLDTVDLLQPNFNF